MKIFLWKKDAFDCAGIRAQVFRLPVNCSNHYATQASNISFSTRRSHWQKFQTQLINLKIILLYFLMMFCIYFILSIFIIFKIHFSNMHRDIYCARLAQLSATFIFSKFTFLKNICLNKFWNLQKCIYFGKFASERKTFGKTFIVLT